MSDATIIAAVLIRLTAWASDPAVMTAIASLLTALAAFWRSMEQEAAAPPPPKPPSLAEAYSTLHEAEEKIREELLQQLQHLQEEAERIGQDLNYRQANATLEEAIIRCPDGGCPVRDQLEAP